MLKYLFAEIRKIKMATDILALSDKNVTVDVSIVSKGSDEFADTICDLIRDGREINPDKPELYYLQGEYKDFNKIRKIIRKFIYNHENEEVRIEFTIRNHGIIEVVFYDADTLLRIREDTLDANFR